MGTTGDHLSAKRILYYSGPPGGFFTIEVRHRHTSGSTSFGSTNGGTNGRQREATYPPRGFFTIQVRHEDSLLLRSAKETPAGAPAAGAPTGAPTGDNGRPLIRQAVSVLFKSPGGIFTIEVRQRNTSGSTSSGSTNGSTNGRQREATYPPSGFFTIQVRQEDSLLLRSAKETPAGKPAAGAPTGVPTGDNGRPLIRQADSLLLRSDKRILYY